MKCLLLSAIAFAGLGSPLGSVSAQTWTLTTAPSSSWQAVASSADGTRLVAVVFNGGIYTSADSGATWVQNTSAPVNRWASVASSADGLSLAAAIYGGQIYTLQLRPQLSLILVSTNLVLSWPVAAGNFNLQQNSNLAGNIWTPVTNQSAVVSSQYQVTVPLGADRNFFRLQGL